MPNTSAPLSYEAFAGEGQPTRRNNFDLHFCGHPGEHMMGDLYRDRPAFQRCIAENPDFRALASALYGLEDRYSPANLKKLYEAYKLLRNYVDTDWELFR